MLFELLTATQDNQNLNKMIKILENHHFKIIINKIDYQFKKINFNQEITLIEINNLVDLKRLNYLFQTNKEFLSFGLLIKFFNKKINDYTINGSITIYNDYLL